MTFCNSYGFPLSIFLMAIYVPSAYAQRENTTRPEVRIPQGVLLGTTITTIHGRNISAFMGIPYAQPPLGNLRFASPIAADGWNGTRDASVDPIMCPQIKNNGVEGFEDCLYINVYAPQLPQSTNPLLRPVMIYVHGGAFKTDSQSSVLLGPKYLLDADVLLVALNYRLGPLGFLSTADEASPGNWGMKDIVLALKWVQDNIRYFGGDPDQVTIFGDSVGGSAVHLLTLTDSTIGLFHRYITQSGSAFTAGTYRPSAQYSHYAFKLGELVGCNNKTSDSLVECLRKVNFTDIIDTESQFMVWRFFPDVLWGPTDEPDVPGALLTDDPANLLAAGKIRDIPWLCGIARDEGLVHTTVLQVTEEIWNDFIENFDTVLPILMGWTYQPDKGAAWAKAAKSHYLNEDRKWNRTELIANITKLVGHGQMAYPLRKSLQQHHAFAKNSQYFYLFNYRGTISFTYVFSGSTASFGVSHGDDIVYLFNMEETFSGINKTMSEKDYQMVDVMVQLWTSFATNGTPTSSALGDSKAWDPYSLADNYLRIGNETEVTLAIQYSLFPEDMEFWSNLDAATNPKSKASSSLASTSTLVLLLSVAFSVYASGRGGPD